MVVSDVIEQFGHAIDHRLFVRMVDGSLQEVASATYVKADPADGGQDYFGPLKVADDQSSAGRGERVVVFELEE